MLYIDFDGVILDTEELLFEDWRRIPDHKNLSEEAKIKYMKSQDWEYILKNSPVINDAVYYLNHMDPSKSIILTKIHSLENEGAEKVKWKQQQGIKQTMILVPYNVRKCDVVEAADNYLIDDALFNLNEWLDLGGIPIFFDKDDDGYDTWGKQNIYGYQRVKRLGEISK